MTVTERDYYQEFFSPDTPDSFLSLSSHDEDKFDLPDFGCEEDITQLPLAADTCDVENIDKHLLELTDQFELEDEDSVSSGAGDSSDDTDMDIKSIPDDIGESSNSGDDDGSSVESTSALEFLDEEAMIRLLGDDSEELIAQRSSHYNTRLNKAEKNTKVGCIDDIRHKDRIGTFNIQNQYDHTLAAQLFLEGEFTFLVLQESFASNSSMGGAWSACRRYELSSARIACIETHHQDIMFDTWRWGDSSIIHLAC